jgi:heparan sulfate 6-O-sulfotransferase HS6ST1
MKNLKSVSVQVIDSDIALLLPNGVYEIKQMEPKSSRLRRIVFFCVALALFGIVGFGYFCPDKVYDEMLNDDFSFDMDSHDVMVFLHMQKTGE